MDIIPTDVGYFELFQEIAVTARKSAETVCSDIDRGKKKKLLTALEKDGDKVVKEVRERLDAHQDPPLEDPDDIYRLVNNVDNVTDSLKKKVTGLIVVYDLDYIPEFMSMGRLVLAATQTIERGMPLLQYIKEDVIPLSRKRKKGGTHEEIQKICTEIIDIESAGDTQEEESLSSIIKRYASPEDHWKSIGAVKVIELLEHALNQCEDVSEFFDTLRKKNA